MFTFTYTKILTYYAHINYYASVFFNCNLTELNQFPKLHCPAYIEQRIILKVFEFIYGIKNQGVYHITSYLCIKDNYVIARNECNTRGKEDFYVKTSKNSQYLNKNLFYEGLRMSNELSNNKYCDKI